MSGSGKVVDCAIFGLIKVGFCLIWKAGHKSTLISCSYI